MLEEPYAPPRPAPPQPAPPPPVAPRPSQIPVQSIVTSEVIDGRRARPRTSRWVRAGLWTLLGSTLLAGLAGAVAPILVLWLAVPAVVGAGLLVVGFFHSLVTPGVRGALAAFVALFIFAVVAVVVAWIGFTTHVAATGWGPMSTPFAIPHAHASPARATWLTLGAYGTPPSQEFETSFLTDARRDWVRQVTGYGRKLSLRRRGKSVSVLIHNGKTTQSAHRVAHAVREMLERELGNRFRSSRHSRFPDAAFARRIAANPPPD
jgi:hypothetical protein